MGIKADVASGDVRRGLEALRDRLAAEIDRDVVAGTCAECRRGGSLIPALAKQLNDVLTHLEAIPAAPVKGTPLDELAKRRTKSAAADGAAVPVPGGRTTRRRQSV